MKPESACDGAQIVRKYDVFQVLPVVLTNAWGRKEEAMGVCPQRREIGNTNAWGVTGVSKQYDM